MRAQSGAWLLIDFDAAAKMGEPAGNKSSSAWDPPEMAVADEHGTVSLRVVGSGLEPLPASPQFDVWSLGVLVFRALARRPLFNRHHSSFE